MAPPAGKQWIDVVSKTAEGGYLIGNPDAKIKLVEFASLTCHVCAQFAKDSGAPLGPIKQATQGSFEILAREDIDSESTSLDKRVRVVATVSYQLR